MKEKLHNLKKVIQYNYLITQSILSSTALGAHRCMDVVCTALYLRGGELHEIHHTFTFYHSTYDVHIADFMNDDVTLMI